MNEELQTPGVEVPAGPQMPGVNMEPGSVEEADEALPVVSPEVAAEVAAEVAVEAPVEQPAAEVEPTESPVIDPMVPVGPN